MKTIYQEITTMNPNQALALWLEKRLARCLIIDLWHREELEELLNQLRNN
jgi:hypothetical protein